MLTGILYVVGFGVFVVLLNSLDDVLMKVIHNRDISFGIFCILLFAGFSAALYGFGMAVTT